MAEQNCTENQMLNQEWICEKRDFEIEIGEMKHLLSSKDKEISTLCC